MAVAPSKYGVFPVTNPPDLRHLILRQIKIISAFQSQRSRDGKHDIRASQNQQRSLAKPTLFNQLQEDLALTPMRVERHGTVDVQYEGCAALHAVFSGENSR